MCVKGSFVEKNQAIIPRAIIQTVDPLALVALLAVILSLIRDVFVATLYTTTAKTHQLLSEPPK